MKCKSPHSTTCQGQVRGQCVIIECTFQIWSYPHQSYITSMRENGNSVLEILQSPPKQASPKQTLSQLLRNIARGSLCNRAAWHHSQRLWNSRTRLDAVDCSAGQDGVWFRNNESTGVQRACIKHTRLMFYRSAFSKCTETNKRPDQMRLMDSAKTSAGTTPTTSA